MEIALSGFMTLPYKEVCKIRRITASTIFYVGVIGLILIAIVIVTTGYYKIINIYEIIFGAIVLLRPKLILEFFKESSQKRRAEFNQLFPDVVYSIVGLTGGIILIIDGATILINAR